MTLTKNFEKRDEILAPYFIDTGYGVDGTRPFKGVPINVLKQLIEEKFIELKGGQNNSEFLKAMEQYSRVQITVGGYTVTDCQVTITSIAIESDDDGSLIEN